MTPDRGKRLKIVLGNLSDVTFDLTTQETLFIVCSHFQESQLCVLEINAIYR